MKFAGFLHAVTKPFRAAWAYRHGEDMVPGDYPVGPTGFKGFGTIQDVPLTGQELLQEAQGENPEPTLPNITTTEGKTGKQV
jgi:hypothetical protein